MATALSVMLDKLTGHQQNAYVHLTELITLTMAAGATTDVAWTPPAGAVFTGIKWCTGTTFTGSPTNINLTIGKTSSGDTTYSGNVDIKTATQPTAVALTASGDYVNWPAGQTMHLTLTANGGTNPAGTCYVTIEFISPLPA